MYDDDCGSSSLSGSAVGASEGERRGRKAVELNAGALSAEEWSYIRGLFLADGYSYVQEKKGGPCYHVGFCLSGGELPLARRVAELLTRVGLNPRVWRHPSKDMCIVLTSSKALLGFLPDKKLLVDDVLRWKRFLSDNGLWSVGLGVPFVAGLIDGDGYCDVAVTRGRSCFGSVNQWKWGFAQRKFRFLVDYVVEFVESLTVEGVRIEERSNGCVVVCFRKVGVEALLGAGILEYLWKGSRWLERVAEVRGERRCYVTTGEVARAMNVSCTAVKKWIKAGKLNGVVRRTVKTRGGREQGSRLSVSWIYVPVEEVELLREQLRKKEVRRSEFGNEMRLVAVAESLGVSLNALHTWRRRGKLHAALVRELGLGRRYVVPREEAERLRKEKDRGERIDD